MKTLIPFLLLVLQLFSACKKDSDGNSGCVIDTKQLLNSDGSLSNTEHYSYDNKSRIVKVESDFYRASISYTSNRIDSKFKFNAASETTEVTSLLDSEGRITTENRGGNKKTYQYNDKGYLIRVLSETSGAVDPSSINVSYKDGNPVELIGINEKSGAITFKIEFKYSDRKFKTVIGHGNPFYHWLFDTPNYLQNFYGREPMNIPDEYWIYELQGTDKIIKVPVEVETDAIGNITYIGHRLGRFRVSYKCN